jgi:hypothetical protein
MREHEIPQTRELVGYRRKRKEHIERMIPKTILKYQQMGREEEFRNTFEMT